MTEHRLITDVGARLMLQIQDAAEKSGRRVSEEIAHRLAVSFEKEAAAKAAPEPDDGHVRRIAREEIAVRLGSLDHIRGA